MKQTTLRREDLEPLPFVDWPDALKALPQAEADPSGPIGGLFKINASALWRHKVTGETFVGPPILRTETVILWTEEG